jgi:hypothetical protein
MKNRLRIPIFPHRNSSSVLRENEAKSALGSPILARWPRGPMVTPAPRLPMDRLGPLLLKLFVWRSTPRPKRPLGCEDAPFGQCGRASLLVDLAGDEMALLIEDLMGS